MARIQGAAMGPTVLKQGIYDLSATQLYPLGERLVLSDGRVFHYAKDGGSGLSAGKLNTVPVVVADHHSMAAATTAAGATSITVTLGATAATADQYAGGYLAVIAGTGLGQIYQIKSHPAADASATCAFALYDELKVALSSSDSKVDLMPNPWYLVTESADEERVSAGVPLVAVTADYFFWDQTWGPAVCLSGDTSAEGNVLERGDTAGEVMTYSAATKGGMVATSWGSARANGEYNLLFLTIAP